MDAFNETQPQITRQRLSWPLRCLVIAGITSNVLGTANLYHLIQVPPAEHDITDSDYRYADEITAKQENMLSPITMSAPQGSPEIKQAPLRIDPLPVPSAEVVKREPSLPASQLEVESSENKNAKPTTPPVVNTAPSVVEKKHPAPLVVPVLPPKVVNQQPVTVPPPVVIPYVVPIAGQKRWANEAIEIHVDGSWTVRGSGGGEFLPE